MKIDYIDIHAGWNLFYYFHWWYWNDQIVYNEAGIYVLHLKNSEGLFNFDRRVYLQSLSSVVQSTSCIAGWICIILLYQISNVPHKILSKEGKFHNIFLVLKRIVDIRVDFFPGWFHQHESEAQDLRRQIKILTWLIIDFFVISMLL